MQLSSSTENGWSIGHKFGQVEFVESLSSHPRYNERNDPRGLRGFFYFLECLSFASTFKLRAYKSFENA